MFRRASGSADKTPSPKVFKELQLKIPHHSLSGTGLQQSLVSSLPAYISLPVY